MQALSAVAGAALLACGSDRSPELQPESSPPAARASSTPATLSGDPPGTIAIAGGATSNVSIDASPDGQTVAVAWYSYDEPAGVERTYVATSTDGGLRFGEPVVVAEPATEYPQVAVGADGSILVGTLTYDLSAQVIDGDKLSWPAWPQLFRSTDGGQTFTAIADLRSIVGARVLIGQQPSTMAASDDGKTIIFAWHDHTPGTSLPPGEPAAVEGTESRPVWASISHDGGKTFGTPQAVSASSCGCCRVSAFVAGDRPGVAFRGLMPLDAEHDERDPMLFLAEEDGRFGVGVEIHDDAFVMELAGCPASGPGVAESDGVIRAAWWTRAPGREGWWFARTAPDGLFAEPLQLPAEFSITLSVELALDGEGTAWVIGHDYSSLTLNLWSISENAAAATPYEAIAPAAARVTGGYDVAGLEHGAIVAWTHDGVVKVLRVGT